MKEKVENPWKKTDRPNFYLEEDAKKIKVFNESLGKHPLYIDLELMPEPYIGNPKANVIFLFTNPGLKGNENDNYEKFPDFRKVLEKNLTHDNTDYPYFYLDPKFEKTDGGKWIRKRMSKIIDKIGDKELSEKIFTIQLHPYHSNEFKEFKEPLEGHNYSMHLLSEAIKRKALIVFTRSHSEWDSAYSKFDNTVKELKKIIGNNFIQLRTPNKKTTPRSPFFIESYMGEENFKKLINKLKEPLQPSL